MIKSKIILDEVIENKDRKFGAATQYYPALAKYKDGVELPLLFTAADIAKARARASKNPEDTEQTRTGFIARLFGF